MGQKHSNPPRFPHPDSQWPEELPKIHRDSYQLLSALVKDRNKRHSLAKLEGDEAQSIADFLNRVLEKESSLEHSERKNVLHTLSLLARSAQVFPECLKLTGVECEFDPDHVRRGLRGDIYKGTFSGGQAVSVKVIHSIPSYTYEELLKIHAKEAILSAHIMHPNVLPFYGVCDLSTTEELKQVCIVSAWTDRNILEYLETAPGPFRYLLMSDIISGLEYMHGLDVIHSDLRAKNVLISNEGRALIADFGASRVVIATQTGSSAGEVNWTSPELILGKVGAATRECDIWAYACTCYEILTGAQPFSEFTANISLLITAFSERRAVPTHSALTTANVDKRVLKKMDDCWNYDPNKRPTASDLCKFFEGLQLVDGREPPDGTANSRVIPDNTEINYDFVLGILQRVQNAPIQTGRRAPLKRR